MQLHQSVATAAEKVLLDDYTPGRAKDTLRKLSALAARNYTNLAGYDPVRTPKTLDTIEEEARALKLDLRGGGKLQNIRTGGVERQLVAFLNEKGKTVTGYFTPKTVLNAKEKVQSAFARVEDACTPEGKLLLSRFLEAAKEKYGPFEAGQDPDEAVLKEIISRSTMSLDEKLSVDGNLLADTILDVCGDYGMLSVDVKNEIGVQNLIDLAEALETYRQSRSNGIGEAGIAEGSRMDTRAAAVSAVADLLGCPNAVTRARPMTIIDENGNEIEGTFTQEDRGCCLDNVPDDKDMGLVGPHSMDETDGSAYRDVANLQILDYLCGRPGRTAEKLNYYFEKKTVAKDQEESWPRLYGVQGVENEGSFGTLAPEPGEQGSKLPDLNNFRVVPRSTYERIMALDPASLKYALRGFGLSEQELDAAGKRLTRLQKELKKSVERDAGVDQLYENAPIQYEEKTEDNLIEVDDFSFSGDVYYRNEEGEKIEGLKLKPGELRVLEDDEFKRLNRENLSATIDKSTGQAAEAGKSLASGNTFYEVYQGILRIPEAAKQKDDWRKAEEPKLVGAGNRCIPEHLRSDAWEANKLSLDLDASTRTFHSSGTYRDLQRAASKYAEYSRKLYQRIELANDPELKALPNYKRDMEAILRPSELKKLRELGSKLEKAAQKYLDRKSKGGKKEEDYDEYTRRRIKNAKAALVLGKRDAMLRPEEEDAARVNERQARENLARRLGDKAEEVYNRKHPPKKTENENVRERPDPGIVKF